MATVLTYYLPPGGTPDHTPAFSAQYSSYYSSSFKYPLVTSKTSTAHAEKDAAILAAGTETVAAALWVSPAQSAHEWTTNDTIEFEGTCRTKSNVTSAYLYMVVRVMNSDCSASRGNLYVGPAPTAVSSSWPGPSRALAAGGGAVAVQNAISMSANDHIVVDIGFTIAGTSQYAATTFYTGDDNAGDLPVDETTSSISYDPWIKFTLQDAGSVVGMAGSVSSVSSVTGSTMALKPFSGSSASLSYVSGDALRIRSFYGGISSLSSMSGDWLRDRAMFGSVFAQSVLSGLSSATKVVYGTIPSTSSVTGKIYGLMSGRGTISAVSSLSASAKADLMFRGTISAISALTGLSSADIMMIGSVAAVSSLTGVTGTGTIANKHIYVKAGGEWVEISPTASVVTDADDGTW